MYANMHNYIHMHSTLYLHVRYIAAYLPGFAGASELSEAASRVKVITAGIETKSR